LTQVSIPAKSTAWLRQKSETKQGHENRLCAVSTEDQNHDLQLAALKKIGYKRIFIEKVTGAYVQRAEQIGCAMW